jgi:HPt (histidine-containing phosphotransfer) domain-containing protein
MKRARTMKELRSIYGEVTSTCAGDTKFMATAMMYLCERLEEHLEELKEGLEQVEERVAQLRKPSSSTRAPTEWQQFVAEGARAGKPMRKIAAEWNSRKVGVQ